MARTALPASAHPIKSWSFQTTHDKDGIREQDVCILGNDDKLYHAWFRAGGQGWGGYEDVTAAG